MKKKKVIVQFLKTKGRQKTIHLAANHFKVLALVWNLVGVKFISVQMREERKGRAQSVIAGLLSELS